MNEILQELDDYDRARCGECGEYLGDWGCATIGCDAGEAGEATRDYPITLPTCEPYRDNETVVDHGARVLAFILRTSCYSTLSDLELDRAYLASQYAIAAKGIDPKYAETLHDVRHVITFYLRERKAEAEAAAQLQAIGGSLKGGIRPVGGDRQPITPVPQPLAPQGVARPVIEPTRRSYVTDGINF